MIQGNCVVRALRRQPLGTFAIATACLLGGCATSHTEADTRERQWHAKQNQAMIALLENRDDDLATSLQELWAHKVLAVQPDGGIPPGAFNRTTAAALERSDVRERLEPTLRSSQSALEAAILAGNATPQQTWVWYDLVTIFDDVPAAVRVVEKAVDEPRIMAQLRKPSSKRNELERAMILCKRPDLAKALEARFDEKLADFLIGPGKPLVTIASSPVWLLH